MAAATQMQALNAVRFLYLEVLKKPLGNVKALRVRRPAHARVALGVEEVRKRAGTFGKQPHVLRHSYATHAHRDGAAARDLQEVLGHGSLNTTMRYLAADAARGRSPIEKLAREISRRDAAGH